MVSVPRRVEQTSVCLPQWMLRPLPLEALIAGLVLHPAINPGVAEIGDLGDEQEVVAAEGLALVPLALLDHLAAVVDLVVGPPESVHGDVVDQLSAGEAVGPDVPPDVADPHDADGSILVLCGVRVAAAAALHRRCHGWLPPFGTGVIEKRVWGTAWGFFQNHAPASPFQGDR